jgi:hypothetical protein
VDCLLEDARENSGNRGAATIVDFKLYYMPEKNDCAALTDEGLLNFQLPLYLTLAEKNGAKAVDTALFFSILQGVPQPLFGTIENRETGKILPKEADQILRKNKNEADNKFESIMKEFWDKTEQYAAEISSGDFSTISKSFGKCSECDYNSICRTTYAVDREPMQLKRSTNDGKR